MKYEKNKPDTSMAFIWNQMKMYVFWLGACVHRNGWSKKDNHVAGFFKAKKMLIYSQDLC